MQLDNTRRGFWAALAAFFAVIAAILSLWWHGRIL